MTTLFISDLHLDAELPHLRDAFEQFMQVQAAEADTLFILGDFFEVWVGDDDHSDYNNSILKLLRDYTNDGGELYLMVGNRDFLMGEEFANACGAILLVDPTRVDIYGVPTLLMHGDSLCTRDSEYVAFRHLSRSPEWQQQMLSQPLDVRKAFAREARQQSQNHNRLQSADIMDVTPSEVQRVMQEYGVQRLIHGHTHRPDRHPLQVNGEAAERIVLGNWGKSIWWLEALEDGSLQLFQQPFDSANTEV